MAGFQTNLVISGIGIPLYSARGLTQTLEAIPQALYQKRTVNGDLKNLARSQFKKYRSTITCRDTRVPAIDGIWPGDTVTVDCVAELPYKTAGGAPSRTVVPNSSRIEGDYTFYRPRLTMLVVSCPISREEWAARNGWTIELEEV